MGDIIYYNRMILKYSVHIIPTESYSIDFESYENKLG